MYIFNVQRGNSGIDEIPVYIIYKGRRESSIDNE